MFGSRSWEGGRGYEKLDKSNEKWRKKSKNPEKKMKNSGKWEYRAGVIRGLVGSLRNFRESVAGTIWVGIAIQEI